MCHLVAQVDRVREVAEQGCIEGDRNLLLLDFKVEAGQIEIAHPVIPELIKDLSIGLSDQGAEFEPC